MKKTLKMPFIVEETNINGGILPINNNEIKELLIYFKKAVDKTRGDVSFGFYDRVILYFDEKYDYYITPKFIKMIEELITPSAEIIFKHRNEAYELKSLKNILNSSFTYYDDDSEYDIGLTFNEITAINLEREQIKNYSLVY